VSAKLTLDEILQELIGIAVGFTRCDACPVYLLEPATCSVVLRASQLPLSLAKILAHSDFNNLRPVTRPTDLL
jgi:hypothetical protein